MTADEQNQARIEAQMKRIIEQSITINRQAQTISDLYVLLQKSLEHAPEFVRIRTAERLREMGMEVEHG